MATVEDVMEAMRESGVLMGGLFMKERYSKFGGQTEYQRKLRTTFIKAFAEGVNKKLAEILEQETTP